MALGTAAIISNGGLGTTGPYMFDLITVVGDGAYPTGGTAGFQAKVRALFGDNREVVAVIPQKCGTYRAVYDKPNDKLVVYAANGSEVSNATDLSGTTFQLLVHTRLWQP